METRRVIVEDVELYLCDACGKPIEGDDWHEAHDADCPNFGLFDTIYMCECEGIYHPDCCPECNENVLEHIEALEA